VAEALRTGPRIFVGLGSNLGDRAGNLLLGVRGMLSAGCRVRRLSSIYETEPVGVEEAQPLYLNMVAELAGADLPPPEQLLARLLRIEYACGRRRSEGRLASRTLDLDLLVYGEEVRGSEFLTLPHPRLHLRRFVLTPLAEIAPELRLVPEGQSVRDLLASVPDSSSVRVWRPS
jgi:2-amino-4-hydroxy-6-hydroxymethyldihydropteridine diphosphokinase